MTKKDYEKIKQFVFDTWFEKKDVLLDKKIEDFMCAHVRTADFADSMYVNPDDKTTNVLAAYIESALETIKENKNGRLVSDFVGYELLAETVSKHDKRCDVNGVGFAELTAQIRLAFSHILGVVKENRQLFDDIFGNGLSDMEIASYLFVQYNVSDKVGLVKVFDKFVNMNAFHDITIHTICKSLEEHYELYGHVDLNQYKDNDMIMIDPKDDVLDLMSKMIGFDKKIVESFASMKRDATNIVRDWLFADKGENKDNLIKGLHERFGEIFIPEEFDRYVERFADKKYMETEVEKETARLADFYLLTKITVYFYERISDDVRTRIRELTRRSAMLAMHVCFVLKIALDGCW